MPFVVAAQVSSVKYKFSYQKTPEKKSYLLPVLEGYSFLEDKVLSDLLHSS